MQNYSTTTCQVNYWIAPIRVRRELTPNSIIDAGCTAFGLTRLALMKRNRKREFVQKKYVIMHVIKKKLSKVSVTKIGELFGVDHTTVVHALRRIKDDLSIDAYRDETMLLINKVLAHL